MVGTVDDAVVVVAADVADIVVSVDGGESPFDVGDRLEMTAKAKW